MHSMMYCSNWIILYSHYVIIIQYSLLLDQFPTMYIYPTFVNIFVPGCGYTNNLIYLQFSLQLLIYRVFVDFRTFVHANTRHFPLFTLLLLNIVLYDVALPTASYCIHDSTSTVTAQSLELILFF